MTKNADSGATVVAPNAEANEASVKSFHDICREILLNGGKKVSNLRVKNVNVNLQPTADGGEYYRVALTVDKPVKGYRTNTETGLMEESTTNVVFVSLYSISAVLKNNPDYAYLGGAVIENPQAVQVLLSGALIDIIQVPVTIGEEYTNPFSTTENSTIFDHDTIINHVVDYRLSNIGLRGADRIMDKLLGITK